MDGLLVDGSLLVSAGHSLVHPCLVLDWRRERRIQEIRRLRWWALHR